jgi:hypothetical protein
MLLVFSGTPIQPLFSPAQVGVPSRQKTLFAMRATHNLFQGERLVTMLRWYGVACHNLHALVSKGRKMCGKVKLLGL